MTVYCDCEKCENNEDGFCYAEKIYMGDGGVCLSCCGIDVEVDEESEDDGNNQRRFTQTGCQSN